MLVSNQLRIYIAVCMFGLIRAVKNKEARHREVPELSEADLTNVTHSKDSPLASGDRMRNSRHSKAKPLTKCLKMQVSQQNLAKANIV